MSKNFLNFLTTSVIILSCGTAINSSSCYCMESKILSPQNQELSQKLLTELSKMDADIKDELKSNQIIVDKNGQPIENASFFIQDFLRSYQITCNNALNKVLKSIGVSKQIIKQCNSCITSCLQLGNQISFILQGLMSSPIIKNKFSFIQFNDPDYKNYCNDEDDNRLRDISFAQLTDVLTKIIKDTGETFNIDDISGINTVKLQHFFNYLNNKILLISINYMQNIKEYIEELIKNNTINVKNIEKTTMNQTSLCGEDVLKIADNLKAYLSSISNNYDFANTQRVLATKINENEYLTSSIKNLADAIKELQQIQKDFNNKNINNIKQVKDNNIKKENNNSLPNKPVLQSMNDINNGEQIENIKQQVEVNNITEENNNSLQNNPGFNSSSENSNNIQPVENSKTISNLVDAVNKNVLLECINVLYDNKLQNTKYGPYLNELRTILLDYAGNIGNLVDTILPKKPTDSDWQFVQPLKKLAYNREYLTNKAQLGLFSLDINNTEYVTFEQLVNFVSNKIADSVNHVINDILSSERRELLSDIRITPDMTLLSSIESIVQIIRKMRSFLQNDDGLQNLAAKSITLKTALTKCNNLLKEPILRLCRLFQDTQSSKTSSKKEQLITSAATNRFIV